MSNQDLHSDQLVETIEVETIEVETAKLGTFQRIRRALSDFLGLVAIACLCTFVLKIGYMWLYAWQHGLYPRVPWPENVIRGPWADNVTIEYAYNQALLVPFLAFLAALLSCIIRPNWRAGIALLLSIVCVPVWFMHLSLMDR